MYADYSIYRPLVSSHPDKVKATVNETIEEISNRFVEITKAYKA